MTQPEEWFLVSHDVGEVPRYWQGDRFQFVGWPPDLTSVVRFATRAAAQEAADKAGLKLDAYTYIAPKPRTDKLRVC